LIFTKHLWDSFKRFVPMEAPTQPWCARTCNLFFF